MRVGAFTLRDDQVRTLRALHEAITEFGGALCADRPGSGKTVIALAVHAAVLTNTTWYPNYYSGKAKPQTFEKLRGLLMMHYSVREKAVVALGQEETLLIVGEIVARLRERLGDRLGGPAA